MPLAWTDAHHLIPWYVQGETNIDELILLCRHHHVLTHEGRWSIRLDHTTGELHVTRPDGAPYELGPSQPHRPMPANPPHWTNRKGKADRADAAGGDASQSDLPDAA